MTNTPYGFKIATTAMALVLGLFAIDTILAEALGPGLRRFSKDITSNEEPLSGRALAGWTATAVLRGDLVANLASAGAASALNGSKAPDPARAGAVRAAALAPATLPRVL